VEQVEVVVLPSARTSRANATIQRMKRRKSNSSTGRAGRPQQQRRMEVMRRSATVMAAWDGVGVSAGSWGGVYGEGDAQRGPEY
jgi:hypothetical protein